MDWRTPGTVGEAMLILLGVWLIASGAGPLVLLGAPLIAVAVASWCRRAHKGPT